MQTRKIAVTIKTIDEKHCSVKCDGFFGRYARTQYCGWRLNEPLYEDSNGYLRTKECMKGEIK